MSTTIGILGTGRMAVRLARLFAGCGHQVVPGPRTPDRAARITRGLDIPSIRSGSYELAADAPVVPPSMFLRDGMLETLEPLGPRFDGELWIDISNPFNDRHDDFILPWNTSGAEEIQRRFPRRNGMTRPRALLVSLVLSIVAATSASADLFSLTASGTISSNTSGDATIPVGTPWIFALVYDTDAPDLDFEQTSSPDPTFGLYTNEGTPPALTFFYYRAGDYEVAISEPADFDTLSDVAITFTSIHAIDIDVHAPDSFPPLSGGEVSFHADFNDFSARPIFQSDALPTDSGLDPESFDEITVSLLPPVGEVSGTVLSSLEIMPVPEPSLAAFEITGLVAVSGLACARKWCPTAGEASRQTNARGEVWRGFAEERSVSSSAAS